jgi:hypothetical protein
MTAAQAAGLKDEIEQLLGKFPASNDGPGEVLTCRGYLVNSSRGPPPLPLGVRLAGRQPVEMDWPVAQP